MRVLWAPWRLSYIEKGDSKPGCIFCDKPRLVSQEERASGLVLRVGEHSSVLMNLYPYANAHLMVAPRTHTADFAALEPAVAAAVHADLQRSVRVLQKAFSPAGFNIGMNLGRCGGAGIADHLHWHIVPRWEGDTNFMPMLADTRVIPQHLQDTYERLLPLFTEEA
ncbi:MAG TPA: HIT domain-containing protein [Candidatus Limnocylindrales bacterium]|nr:HIT domain-containing protein [Candidatus Limnocylindrales bacterium]